MLTKHEEREHKTTTQPEIERLHSIAQVVHVFSEAEIEVEEYNENFLEVSHDSGWMNH